MNFINAAVYQVAIYYAQYVWLVNYSQYRIAVELKEERKKYPIMYGGSNEEKPIYYCAYTYQEMFEVHVTEDKKTRYDIINEQELASYWIMIEVAFYYISVFLTIVYLFKSHCFKISNSKEPADTSRGGSEGLLNMKYDFFDNQIVKVSELKDREDQDYLSLSHSVLSEYLAVGTIFFECLYLMFIGWGYSY